nr:hypothetical protein [Endozoicomonas sp.]
MATTNIWQQFKALIQEGVGVVATITANNGTTTSHSDQSQLRDGSVITVKGESISTGQKAFIKKYCAKSGAVRGGGMRKSRIKTHPGFQAYPRHGLECPMKTLSRQSDI